MRHCFRFPNCEHIFFTSAQGGIHNIITLLCEVQPLHRSNKLLKVFNSSITMVSSLSSRLLAGRGDCASLGSSKDNGSPRNKRTAAGSSKTRRPNDKNESTMSGYSADREGQSAFPPVVSINLHSKSKSSTRVEALNCPKRRKKNEMQFAATTVKADLARAGKEFKSLGKDLERATILGNETINFKDHVELFNSKDIPDSLYPQSNIAKQTTTSDYAALISTVSSFYPCKPTRMNDLKPFERGLPTGANGWSEPSASSSVSDTLSDSGSDNTNNPTSALSPLLEDSLDSGRKKNKNKQNIRKTTIKASDDVSSLSNAITMTKILQLSKTARYVQPMFYSLF